MKIGKVSLAYQPSQLFLSSPIVIVDIASSSSSDKMASIASTIAEDSDSSKDIDDEASIDDAMKTTLKRIPLLKTRAGPRDKPELWTARLKEEYLALIQFVKQNKETDMDWFSIKSNKEGTKWEGSCWYYCDNVKYEFGICFDIPVTYPATAPEIKIPELDGKTVKMYHGGKICLTVHFHPLWAKNVPRFGIAHALALGKC